MLRTLVFLYFILFSTSIFSKEIPIIVISAGKSPQSYSSVGSQVTVIDSEDNFSHVHTQDSESIAKPFDTPPVEMTDERVDRLYRIGVFAAVVAIVLLLIRRKKNST